MIVKAKDSVVQKVVKMVINFYAKEYGKMLKLDLDSKAKSVSLEVMLDGEKEALSVKISNYEIVEERSKYFLKINGIRTSRAWINTIASSYLEGELFEIPEEYVKILMLIV